MFVDRKPFKAPSGSETKYEVRSAKGRKGHDTETEARQAAKDIRSDGGWASVHAVVTIELEKRK